MGFTVRFMLGAVLVLLCCWSIETTQLRRQTRQINNNGDTKPTDKLQKIEDERTIPQSNLANLNQDEINKPKTDISTEDNKNIDKQNSLIGHLQKSEAYKKVTNQPEIKNTREETARSIDIEKYVSEDFHNKNNVYTLPISLDTEKYIDPDYDFHSTTHKYQEHTKGFHFESELTTPKSSIFDHKYKEAVESVEQKLEHIDDSQEVSSESESKETLNLEKLYEETKNNNSDADLNYINFKNIIKSDNGSKNSLHKDLVVEAGTNIDYRSSHNKTTIIGENDSGNNTIVKEQVKEKIETSTISNTIPVKGDLERSETATIKSTILTTRKSLVLTKPPSNKNSSHISILSNKIETETLKAIDPIQSESSTTEKPKGDKETASEIYTRRTPIDITKRGSIKFSDYGQLSSTQPTVMTNKKNKKTEQLLQENQVIPVLLESTLAAENVTTEASVTKELTQPIVTTTITQSSTPEIVSTTTFLTTSEIITTETIAVTEQPVTTEFSTTDFADQTTTTELATTTTTVEPTTMTTIPTTELPATEETTLEPTTVESTVSTTDAAEMMQSNPTVTDFDQNMTITTDNIVRTSKGLVFNENIITTQPISTTTEIPMTETETPTTETLTTESLESTILTLTPTTELITETTYETTETRNEEQQTTTDTIHVTVNNHTSSVPDLNRHDQNEYTLEPETSTENHTISETYELNTNTPEDNSGTIAAIAISSIGAVCLILLAGLLVIMRKRQKRFNYGQRCTPVSLDDYSMDNISVYNSVRRKGMLRSSKRSYGNPAFEDPASVSHPLNFPALGKFANNLEDIKAEFEEIPQITARTNELPEGCDTKNRYANVIPLPETRVFLIYNEGYPNSDYINANYVTGPKNTKGYYIACQAPMLHTVDDFWRMIWEQQSKVILMLTHLFENGVEKCVDYLPPSEVLDCHRLFGDFQVTLKKREVKDKYIISILQLKNMVSNSWREVTHFWYLGWPERGVPSEANSLIAFLIEARSYMKSSSMDRKDVTNGNLTNGTAKNDLNPVVVHCSPGTGRTGVVIACDIAIREFEKTRLVDVPRIVYKIRRDRASSVQTKEQYAFIYKVIYLYAAKLTGGALDSL